MAGISNKRMNRVVVSVLGCVGAALLVGSLFITDFFLSLIFFSAAFLLVGVCLVFVASALFLVKNLGKFRIVVLSVGNLLLGVGLIFFALILGVPTMRDLSDYSNGNYSYVEGKVERYSDVSSRRGVTFWHEYTVNGIRLKSKYELSEEGLASMLRFEYYPHSKVVRDISFWQPQAEDREGARQ